MKVVYADAEVEMQCTSLKAAKKLFGGDEKLARSLLARVNTLNNAEVIKDIIVLRPLRFHKLKGREEGYFVIDVKSRKEPWRIILQPLDENEKVFRPCNIDEIAGIVRIVEVREVSKHYE